MKIDLTNGLSDELLAKVRRHKDGSENLKSRAMPCHYCNRKAIIVFDDSQGHVQAKCKYCGRESIYNVVLRRNGTLPFKSARVKQRNQR